LLLENTNRKAHAGSRMHRSAWPYGDLNWATSLIARHWRCEYLKRDRAELTTRRWVWITGWFIMVALCNMYYV